MDLGIIPITAITVICGLIAQAIKATALDRKWLPVICGFCGALLGCLAERAMPSFPAGDPLTALALGIASGLASTGSHQLYKQLFGGIKDNESD